MAEEEAKAENQIGQQVQEQRSIFQRALETLKDIPKKLITPRQIYGGIGTPETFIQRQAVKQQVQAQEKQIKEQEVQYEKQVARYAPEYAKKEYVEEAYTEAKSTIQPKIEQLQSQIQSFQARREKIAEGGISGKEAREFQEAEDQIKNTQRVLNLYKGALGDKLTLVKDYYSGNLQAKEAYEAARQERAMAKAGTRRERISTAPALSAATIAASLAEQYPELKTGELMDIARKFYPKQFATPVGAKPQLEFKETQEGVEITRIQPPAAAIAASLAEAEKMDLITATDIGARTPYVISPKEAEPTRFEKAFAMTVEQAKRAWAETIAPPKALDITKVGVAPYLAEAARSFVVSIPAWPRKIEKGIEEAAAKGYELVGITPERRKLELRFQPGAIDLIGGMPIGIRGPTLAGLTLEPAIIPKAPGQISLVKDIPAEKALAKVVTTAGELYLWGKGAEALGAIRGLGGLVKYGVQTGITAMSAQQLKQLSKIEKELPSTVDIETAAEGFKKEEWKEFLSTPEGIRHQKEIEDYNKQIEEAQRQILIGRIGAGAGLAIGVGTLGLEAYRFAREPTRVRLTTVQQEQLIDRLKRSLPSKIENPRTAQEIALNKRVDAMRRQLEKYEEKSLGVSVQKPVITEKGVKVLEPITITRITPPGLAYETERWQKFLTRISPFEEPITLKLFPSLAPRVIEVTKPSISQVTAILKAIETEEGTFTLPSLTVSQRIGAQKQTIGLLTGSASSIEIERIAQMENYQKYIIARAIENINNLPKGTVGINDVQRYVRALYTGEKQISLGVSEWEQIFTRRAVRGREPLPQPKIEWLGKGKLKVEGKEVLGAYTPGEERIMMAVPEEGVLFGKNVDYIVKHERGHYYIWKKGMLKSLTPEQESDLFIKAQNYLFKKYKGNIPYKETEYINEYLATKIGARTTQDVLRSYWKTIPAGRRTTRAEILTVTEPIKTITLGGVTMKVPPESQLYVSDVFFKDITYPFPRAAGAVPSAKFITKVLPAEKGTPFIDFIPEKSRLRKITEEFVSAEGVKESTKAFISPQLSKALQVQRGALFMGLPKAPLEAIKITPTAIDKAAQVLAPRITAAGLALRIEPTAKVTAREQVRVTEKITGIDLTKAVDLAKAVDLIKDVRLAKVTAKAVELARVTELARATRLERVTAKAVDLAKVIGVAKPIGLMKPIQIKLIKKTFAVPRPIKEPRLAPPERILLPSYKKTVSYAKPSKIITRLKKRPGYEILIKRRGKERPLGVSLTYESAMGIAAKELKKSLAAGARLVPTEKPGKELGLKAPKGYEFRRYVIRKGVPIPDPFRIIQRRPFRLGTVREVKEIQLARMRAAGGFI